MKEKGMSTFAVVAVLVLVVSMVFLFLYNPAGSANPPKITLPPVSSAQPGITLPPAGELDRTEVNRETVQSALSSLERTQSYSREFTVTLIADGELSGGFKVSVLSLNGDLRITKDRGGEQENHLIKDGMHWIWYQGEDGFYVGPASKGNALSYADLWQGIVTYEDVLSLDPELIIDAGYTEYDGESCIFVEYTGGSFSYTTDLFISVGSGLLMGSGVFSDGSLVYAVTSEGISLSPPDAELFLPPSPAV